MKTYYRYRFPTVSRGTYRLAYRQQGFKFEFFSSIRQRDTSNLKSGIHPENLVFHICKTSSRSRALPVERIFSSHFKLLTTLCFFILCLYWLWHFFERVYPAQSNSITFHFVYLLVLFSFRKISCGQNFFQYPLGY
jgi:hypothetical protein